MARPPGNGIRRWRTVVRKLRRRRTCAECGFLAYGDGEARLADRLLLGSGSSSGASPSGPAERWDCAKGLWLWELGYIQPDWSVVFDEAAKDRRGCRGFRKWKPGWGPAQHAESEEKSVDFRRQLMLKATPKAIAALCGMIGAALTYIVGCYWAD